MTIEREEIILREVGWDTASNVLIERGKYHGGITFSSPYAPVDGNNSTITVPRLDRHNVGVEENSNIPCSTQEIDPREVRMQVGEDIYTGFRDIAKGSGYLEIRRERHVDEVEDLRNRVRGHVKPE